MLVTICGCECNLNTNEFIALLLEWLLAKKSDTAKPFHFPFKTVFEKYSE